MEGRRFVEFVREIEGKLTDEERRELDAWREHFRGDDDTLGAREPRKPKLPPLLDEHYGSEVYKAGSQRVAAESALRAAGETP